MKALLLILGVAVAGLSIACLHLYRQVGDEREIVSVEVGKRADLQARVILLEKERGGETVAAPAIAPAPLSARAGSSSIAGAEENSRAGRRRMLKDSTSREVLRGQQRAQLEHAAPDLREELQLTDDLYGQLMEMLAENRLARAEVFSRSRDIEPDMSSDLTRLRENEKRQVAALLGASKAEEYDSYMESLPIRQQVRQYRGRLSESNALSDDQDKRLIATLQQARERFDEAMKERYAGHEVTNTGEYWDGSRVMASESMGTPVEAQYNEQMEAYYAQSARSAAQVLNPSQLAEFQKTLDLRMAERRAMTREEAVNSGR